MYRSWKAFLCIDKVMDSVVPTPKLGEFITRVFHNGVVLGRKLLPVNQFMLLCVSHAVRQTASG